jgi:hypothetical protein
MWHPVGWQKNSAVIFRAEKKIMKMRATDSFKTLVHFYKDTMTGSVQKKNESM